MKRILVLGQNGQLAQALARVSARPEAQYLSRAVLDLSKYSLIYDQLSAMDFDILINCMAYTAVDKAEDEPRLAALINAEALNPIAEACRDRNALLVHVSTDYVYGEVPPKPIDEGQATHPFNVYGRTKLAGEELLRSVWDKHYIIRTSWLYGPGGHNFVNTMRRLSAELKSPQVVYDQVGTPTSANDLAEAIWHMVLYGEDPSTWGTYHYSNEGVCSWYDFAQAIFDKEGKGSLAVPILSEAYPTQARRPAYSVMSKQKIKNTFGIYVPHWHRALMESLDNWY